MEENAVVEEQQTQEPMTFDEMLASNKDFQKEFDRRISQGINTARTNWEETYSKQLTEKLEKDFETRKSEAEKLAKMNAEEKAKYEYDKLLKENQKLLGEINATNLYKEATNIAKEMGIPIEYLNTIDFAKETAESVKSKLSSISEIRNKDMELYLKSALRQTPPQEKKRSVEKLDPFVEGFKSEFY